MTWRPKYILYGAIFAIACLTMFSAADEQLKLVILLGLCAIVAAVEWRRR
jgi:hypothetical protein